MVSPGERRKRRRVALHWSLRIYRLEGDWIESATENLSSEGLYCIVPRPFEVGARLQCEVVFPEASLGLLEESPRLKCAVVVTRVEALDEGFGLGCHIDDYALVGLLSPAAERSLPVGF